MIEFLQSILGEDLQHAGIIILNILLIESLLSIDNAAVMATMVMDLPPVQRQRALTIGIGVGYVFRGLCLFFASYLIKIWWLKPIGGLYLLYLTYDYFSKEATPSEDDDLLNKNENRFFKYFKNTLGTFWATVLSVELMDLTFSIDNVLAVVAFTDNIYMIWFGVFIGILAMRFVARYFIKLMEKYPFLEKTAFLVIGILGLKLVLSLVNHYLPDTAFAHFLENEKTDMYVSILTALIFFVPLATSHFFNYPKKNVS